MSVYIIYPERRIVDDETIEMWYIDALANREIAEEYLHAKTIDQMARALDDAGIVTLGTGDQS